MDELWQRYRTFWTPVLMGLGIFLVGVIAVHVMTDDPEEAANRLGLERTKLARKIQPTKAQIDAQDDRAANLERHVIDWANRLDQTGGASGDVIELAVDQALRAAILRGATVEESASDSAVATLFGGDEVAARIARRHFEKVRQDRIDALRTADPNVGFSRLKEDVWSEIQVRANRADVDLRAERLGFASVTSVTRSSLPQRLLNLALVARIANAAVETGMHSIDTIQIDRPDATRTDAFLSEWWVEFAMTGPMPAVKRILDLATDPAHPITIGDTILGLPKARNPHTGIVQLRMRAYSLRVQPTAMLHMDEEEDE